MADMPINNQAAVRTRQRERDAQQLAKFGASPAALRMARPLQFGMVWINPRIPLANEAPYGGYTQSGYGKDMGIYSRAGYAQFKHVVASHE